MKFIKDTCQVLQNTTWPNKKKRWYDFISVVEYATFFVLVIYFFDHAIAKGFFGLMNLF